MSINNKYSSFEKLATIVDSFLKQEEFGGSSTLNKALAYSVNSQGKRIRSVIALAVGSAIGVDVNRLKSLCLGIEYLHTATLIHDDLPALDNDETRRGKPCCHKVYGEGQAILLGDLMQARAVSFILCDKNLSDEEKVNIARDLTQLTAEICHGQSLDISTLEEEFLLKLSDEELKLLLEKIALSKTASFFSFAASAPCYLMSSQLSECDQKPHIERLSIFGRNLGILFQILDDIKDSVEAHSVKASGRFVPVSYVTVFGLAQSQALAKEYYHKALEDIDYLQEGGMGLREICNKVMHSLSTHSF